MDKADEESRDASGDMPVIRRSFDRQTPGKLVAGTTEMRFEADHPIARIAERHAQFVPSRGELAQVGEAIVSGPARPLEKRGDAGSCDGAPGGIPQIENQPPRARATARRTLDIPP